MNILSIAAILEHLPSCEAFLSECLEDLPASKIL